MNIINIKQGIGSNQKAEVKRSNRIPLFCFVTMLFWFSMYTYVPILASYVESLGASHQMAGIIVGSYGFVQMVLRIPLGIASDKLHKRRLFINFGMCFALFSGLGLLVFKDMTLILIFRAFAGAAAATWVDFTILFTSYFLHEESTKAIGIISFYNSIGQMLAMLTGSFMADRIGWRAPFALGAGVALIGLIASLFIVEKFNDKEDPITLKGVFEVISDHTLISVSILAILSQALTFATIFGFTPVYATSLGAGKFEMGLLTVFSSLPTAFASLIGGGILSRKFGERNVVVFGFILMGVFTITIPFTHSFSILMITQAFAGLGRGFSFPVLMGLSIKDMPSNRRATAMGFFQSIYGLGMFIGPMLMGILGDMFSLKDGFIMLGIIGCLTALLSKYMIRNSI